MKNLFKIKESLVKSIFLFLLLLAPSTVFAETNFSASKWTYHCNKNNVCFLGVKAELDEQGSKKEKRTLATLIIQLVDNVPVLFARLPLNTTTVDELCSYFPRTFSFDMLLLIFPRTDTETRSNRGRFYLMWTFDAN